MKSIEAYNYRDIDNARFPIYIQYFVQTKEMIKSAYFDIVVHKPFFRRDIGS